MVHNQGFPLATFSIALLVLRHSLHCWCSHLFNLEEQSSRVHLWSALKTANQCCTWPLSTQSGIYNSGNIEHVNIFFSTGLFCWTIDMKVLPRHLQPYCCKCIAIQQFTGVFPNLPSVSTIGAVIWCWAEESDVLKSVWKVLWVLIGNKEVAGVRWETFVFDNHFILCNSLGTKHHFPLLLCLLAGLKLSALVGLTGLRVVRFYCHVSWFTALSSVQYFLFLPFHVMTTIFWWLKVQFFFFKCIDFLV